MRKTKPIIAPAVSPLAGPRSHTDRDHAAHGQHGEQLAGGEQQRPDHPGADLRRLATVDGIATALRSERLAGVVGPDRLGAADDLADRPHHLAVALAGRLVGRHEVALDDAQDERQRGGEGEGDEGETPVVGQHHGADEEHQRSVEQPRHAAPLEELGQRLDVARHAGDQGATTLLVVVGEAEPVDVADQPAAQVVQRLLAACAEAHDGVALGDPGDDEGARRRSTPSIGDEADAHAPRHR